jgi:hypothetical protein
VESVFEMDSFTSNRHRWVVCKFNGLCLINRNMFEAPEDFPESLPDEPLNYDKSRQLVDDWSNVARISGIDWEMRNGEKVCVSLIFHTQDGRGFGVYWDDGEWEVLEKYDVCENILEIPCSDDELVEFVDSNTTDESKYYVYVLSCKLPDKETAEKRVKNLYPPKTKEEVRGYFIENNSVRWNERSEAEQNRILERESGFNPPGWFREGLRAESAYYVGYTNNVQKRIKEHLEGADAGGAYFTEVFPPTHLVEIHGFNTKSEAKEAESRVRSEMGPGFWNDDVVSYSM